MKMHRCCAKDLKLGDIIRVEDERFSPIVQVAYMPGELIAGTGNGKVATALKIVTGDGDTISVHPDEPFTTNGKAKRPIQKWAIFGGK